MRRDLFAIGALSLVAQVAGLSMDEYIANNDAYHFFKKAGGLVITGPTQTNVMDIIITIIK